MLQARYTEKFEEKNCSIEIFTDLCKRLYDLLKREIPSLLSTQTIKVQLFQGFQAIEKVEMNFKIRVRTGN